jgi:CHAT domain-containing protein/Tfp pilus assembly protein PilF
MRALAFFFVMLLSCPCLGQEKTIARIDSLAGAGDYAAAKSLASDAARMAGPVERNRLGNKLAEVLILQGNLDEAEKQLSELATDTRNDPFQFAETKTNLGFLYLNRARNDMALTSLQEAAELFQRAGQSNSREAARSLSTLSIVYLATGKLNQAEENGRVALQIRQRLAGDASEEVAASYNDLGLIYGTSDPDKALEYYEKALAVYEKLHGKEHRKIAIASSNMGVVYRSLRLYGDAINNFETAEAIWKRIYSDGHPSHAFTLLNLGLTYAQMSNTTAAMGYYDRALAMYRKAYGERHSDISAVLNQMGILSAEGGEVDKALTFYQQALIANAPNFTATLTASNPRVTEYYNAKVLLYTLRLKAEALETRHFTKTLKLSDLELALGTLQSCDTLIDNIRFGSTNESDKLELGASAADVYESGVRIAEAISEMTLRGRPFQETSFYFAEKSKSAVLFESIADAEAKSFAGIPAELLESENAQRATLALLTQKLSQKPSAEEESRLREQLFNTHRDYQAFVRKLEKDYPDYFNLKFNRAAPSINDVQKKLKNGQAVVSYFIAEKKARLYSFIITPTKFRLLNSTIPDDFDKLLRGFTNSIFYSASDVYVQSADRLSRLLLRGLPAIDEVIIIPAGKLGTLPFEALFLGSPPKGHDYGALPYLGIKIAVSYEFSAGLLLQKSKYGARPAKSILLCAPISFPLKDNLNDLPGTQQEVASISKLFGPGAIVITGKEANEGLVKSGGLSDFQYLHFATHGIVDETAPELSRIYLQDTESEDGNVFSGEIFNLKLNADLAVLSACQTGLGKFSKGEGVIGLSRALVYAGARSIMVSYWSVADESTAELMTDFYQILITKPGLGARRALQEAKASMVKKRRYAAPYFWAPFVLIGI